MISSNRATRAPSPHTTTLSTRSAGRRRCGDYAGAVLTASRPADRGPISMDGGAR